MKCIFSHVDATSTRFPTTGAHKDVFTDKHTNFLAYELAIALVTLSRQCRLRVTDQFDELFFVLTFLVQRWPDFEYYQKYYSYLPQYFGYYRLHRS